MKIYEITWLDSASLDAWMDIDSVSDELLSRCVSVGYVVKVTDKAVILASGYNDADQITGQFGIPRGCIISARRL